MVTILAGWVLGAVVLGLVIGAAVRLADWHEAGPQWRVPSSPAGDLDVPVAAWRQAG